MRNLKRSENPSTLMLGIRPIQGMHFPLYGTTLLSPHIPDVGFVATHPRFKDVSKRTWAKSFHGQLDAAVTVSRMDKTREEGLVRHVAGGWAGWNAKERFKRRAAAVFPVSDGIHGGVGLAQGQGQGQVRGMQTRTRNANARTTSASAPSGLNPQGQTYTINPTPAQPERDWISTTSSFDWAFYELPRRLARKEELPKRADGTENAGAGAPEASGAEWKVDKVHMAIIRPPRYSRGYKGPRMGCVRDVGDLLSAHQARRRDEGARQDEREVNDAATRFALASSEQLYLGKVFNDDVMKVVASDRKRFFTSRHDPLVKHFFRSPKYCPPGGTWLACLVFDPNVESFAVAQAKIDARRVYLEESGFYNHIKAEQMDKA